jgi:UDP-N-acetylglucosamine--N-acetylmuramyl-(pentapeptide) pyrophosphoryl-undecaprenol N-acetylglucosamine transferase
MSAKKIRLVCAGGGSGGHIYPALAVIDELKKIFSTDEFAGSRVEMYYIGSPQEYAIEFARRNVIIKHVVSFKMRRYLSARNIMDALVMPFAFVQALWHLFWIMPDVVFSKGGSGSLPVVFAAFFFHIPIFVHESDSIPGLSNRIAFPLATRVGLSFEKTLSFVSGAKVAVVGNPIRASLVENAGGAQSAKAKTIFGFSPDVPLVLILGGSQGSARINDFVIENAHMLVRITQVLHQTGALNFQGVKSELAVATKDFIPAERNRYKLVDYLRDEIIEAMLAADVIISRAGSGAIFEIAAFGKASILIPLKESAQNHQFYNAHEYARAGACDVIEEENLKPALFAQEVKRILENHDIKKSMEDAARQFAKPQAAYMIAREIARLV